MKFTICLLLKSIFEIYNTALHLAVKNGNTEIVKLLLKAKGIDIKTKDLIVIFDINQVH